MVTTAWRATHVLVLLAAGIALGCAITMDDQTRVTLIVVALIVFLAWANERRRR